MVRSTFGRLDLLFNNAGANVSPTTVDQMSYADWRAVVGINLDAAFHVARESFVLMKEQAPQGGRIINNGSVSAAVPRPGSVAYTASKHGLSGLTKSLSLDGRAHSIACGQIDYGNVVSAISAGMAVGMPQARALLLDCHTTSTPAPDSSLAVAMLPPLDRSPRLPPFPAAQADGSVRAEPRMSQDDAADAVFYMAQLPLSANVLQMTVMATNMPYVGRG